MTPEQIAAIEARLAAATPGPIQINRYDNEGGEISYQLQTKSGSVLCAFSDDDDPNAKRDAAFHAHAPTDIRALLDENKRLKAQSESWRASSVKWQQWAGNLLDELGRQPLGGQHGDESAREIIAQLAGVAPGVPRCERCGCFASRHEVDDEEFRACADCECAQYLVP